MERPRHVIGASATYAVTGTSARHTFNTDTYMIEVYATMGGTEIKLGDAAVVITALGEAGVVRVPIMQPDFHQVDKPDADRTFRHVALAYAGNGGQLTIVEYFTADRVRNVATPATD